MALETVGVDAVYEDAKLAVPRESIQLVQCLPQRSRLDLHLAVLVETFPENDADHEEGSPFPD